MSFGHEDARAAQQPGAAASPPRAQLMDRRSSLDGADPERIPAAVFERNPSESNKDWSMMSTESVFGLQVAPSSDFTGFFLAHPELMDIATPPRSSTVAMSPPRTSTVDAAADAKATVILPPFESIPEFADNKGNYSFAFPNLIEDKRNFSKKVQQQQQEEQKPEAAAPMEPPAAVAPPPAEAEAQARRQASSKAEAAPGPGAGKGGLFSCFPCCG